MSASQHIVLLCLSSSGSVCRDRSALSKLRSLADSACGSGVSRGNVMGFNFRGWGELFRHHQSPISSGLSLCPFFAQSELSVIWLWAGLIGHSE